MEATIFYILLDEFFNDKFSNQVEFFYKFGNDRKFNKTMRNINIFSTQARGSQLAHPGGL